MASCEYCYNRGESRFCRKVEKIHADSCEFYQECRVPVLDQGLLQRYILFIKGHTVTRIKNAWEYFNSIAPPARYVKLDKRRREMLTRCPICKNQFATHQGLFRHIAKLHYGKELSKARWEGGVNPEIIEEIRRIFRFHHVLCPSYKDKEEFGELDFFYMFMEQNIADPDSLLADDEVLDEWFADSNLLKLARLLELIRNE